MTSIEAALPRPGPSPHLEEVLHRELAAVYRGDCLELLRSLPEHSIDLIVTDPAYSGMNEHMSFGHGRIVGARSDPGCDRWFEEFHDDPETFLEFLRACDRVLREDRHLYVMFDSFSLLSLGHLVREVFQVKNLLVWDKVRLGMGHYYRRRHELILFATKGRRKLATRSSPDVLAVPRLTRAAYPTQKPVALFRAMLQESVEPGMVVLDPFAGTASVGIAALQAGCRFVGGDSAPRACELSAQRLAAVLDGEEDPLEPPTNREKRR